MPPVLRHLYFGPRADSSGEVIVTRPAWASIACTLGLFLRSVRIDPQARRIVATDRLGWFFTRERIVGFDEIADIEYGTDNFFPSALSNLLSLESWIITIRFEDLTTFDIFRFSGNFHSPALMAALGFHDLDWASEPNRERLLMGSLLNAFLPAQRRRRRPPTNF